MAETLKNIELIEQYFEGRLSEVDKNAFESRLVSDSEFMEEVLLYKNIVAGIKENGEDNLKARLKVADLELDSLPGKIVELESKRKSSYKYLAIAASIVLIIGLSLLWKFYPENNLSSLADSYYEKDKGLPIEMGINKTQWDDAMNSYKSGDYVKAKASLELILKTNSENDTANYYCGIVSYELEDYTFSEAMLSKIKPESMFFEKAQYRLILIDLKGNNKSNALISIESCLKNENHLYFSKLKELKEKLSD